jgi:phosphoribosylformimino-5-aminoimidazole carboxamide ribotide isomerase
MKVLAVLDVLKGQVVRGVAGRRDEYRPIVSQLTSSSDPLTVARAIRDSFELEDFYLADLDGILLQKPNLDLYRRLTTDGFQLLVDAGVRQPSDVLSIQRDAKIHVVVGLETCNSPEKLARIIACASSVTFSLDLLHGLPQFSADASGWSTELNEIVGQVVEANVTSIIVLDLSDVGMGTGGSTDSICNFIHKEFPTVEIIAGGGVRSRDDLNRLNCLGVEAVLVASALHDGKLIPEDLLF